MPYEIWSFIELDIAGKLNDISRKIASEAKRTAQILGGVPCGVSAGENLTQLAKDLEKFGLQKLYLLQLEAGQEKPENYVEALAATETKYKPHMILFSTSATGSEVASRLAAKLCRGLISNCIDFEKQPTGPPIGRKKILGGKANAICVWRTESPYLATVDIDSMEIIEQRTFTKPQIVEEKVKTSSSMVKLLGKTRVSRKEIDITEARVVIGVGRGIGDARNMEFFEKLADLLDAPIGGTRMAVYNGLIPPEKQIGLSGKWISPEVYLAVALSGASQHLIGIKGAKHIVAVNIDKNAPIIGVSELGIVDDYKNTIQELIKVSEQK